MARDERARSVGREGPLYQRSWWRKRRARPNRKGSHVQARARQVDDGAPRGASGGCGEVDAGAHDRQWGMEPTLAALRRDANRRLREEEKSGPVCVCVCARALSFSLPPPGVETAACLLLLLAENMVIAAENCPCAQSGPPVEFPYRATSPLSGTHHHHAIAAPTIIMSVRAPACRLGRTGVYFLFVPLAPCLRSIRCTTPPKEHM